MEDKGVVGKREAEDGRLEQVEPAGVECEHCVVRRQEAPHAAQPQARSPYSSLTVVPPFKIEYQCLYLASHHSGLRYWIILPYITASFQTATISFVDEFSNEAVVLFSNFKFRAALITVVPDELRWWHPLGSHPSHHLVITSANCQLR